ncbi:MAG: FISUMP domain-containing protein [Prolixibacteraceae bacterium]|jgi:uncharacterized protein (TIGR02145 family)|nr:FISUMP domain-containing protein [Prolixibacteraceae bacterium]
MNRIYIVLLVFLLNACRHEIEFEVSKPVIEYITHNSCRISYEVYNDDYYSPEKLGFCLSEIPNYDDRSKISLPKTRDGYFESIIPNLKPSTTYYLKGVCEEGEQLYFSDEVTFETKTIQTFTDERDGNEYTILNYPSQQWMGENLKYVFESDLIKEATVEESYCTGAYYAYEIADKVCPSGWHLPSDEEWLNLELFLGMESEEANKMFYNRGNIAKEMFLAGWGNYQNWNFKINNKSGFSILPAGRKSAENKDVGRGRRAYFWSSTEVESDLIIREFDITADGIGRIPFSGEYCSIRCGKDK